MHKMVWNCFASFWRPWLQQSEEVKKMTKKNKSIKNYYRNSSSLMQTNQDHFIDERDMIIIFKHAWMWLFNKAILTAVQRLFPSFICINKWTKIKRYCLWHLAFISFNCISWGLAEPGFWVCVNTKDAQPWASGYFFITN